MKALFSLTALLLCAIQSVTADDVACIQGIESTMSYQAALRVHTAAENAFHGRPCPTVVANGKTVQYFLAPNSAGCCAETATAHVLGKKAAACCPCGAECTGFFPKEMDWIVANGKFAVATPAETTTVIRATAPSANAAKVTGSFSYGKDR